MHRKPLLLLLIFTIFIPELISGATPLPRLVLPFSWVLYLFAYGIPVLLIRELAVRYRVGLSGTVVFGLAYGIVNEGLFAKTLVKAVHLPIDKYDHYGYALGVSFPWMAAICTWHAFASVVFPIALVHYLFPESSDKPWLKLPTAFALFAADLAIASLMFFQLKIPDTRHDPGMLVLLLLFMLVLFAIGLRFRGKPIEMAGERSVKPLLCGMCAFVPFLVLIILAAGKAPLPLYFLALIGMAALSIRIIKHKGWQNSPSLLCVAIGWYASYAAFALLSLLGNPILLGITAVVDGAILAAMWRAVGSRPDVTVL